MEWIAAISVVNEGMEYNVAKGEGAVRVGVEPFTGGEETWLAVGAVATEANARTGAVGKVLRG